MKQKVNNLVRLHKAMQEKLKTASYSEQIEILTLVPDKWSPMCNVFVFNVFEYLVWTSHEIKKLDEILAKLAPKKGKTITTETLLLHNFSRYVPGNRDYVIVSKEVHKQKLGNLQKSLQLTRIISCFQRKTPKCKHQVPNVLCLETQMVCSGQSKNDSLYLRLQRSQKCFVASRCNRVGLDIERPDQKDRLQT